MILVSLGMRVRYGQSSGVPLYTWPCLCWTVPVAVTKCYSGHSVFGTVGVGIYRVFSVSIEFRGR